ncbi:esterase [Variovorax sp. WS11]|nr:alpha/beta hydrolase [Variovorax sp. WS11]PSL85014.1 esterase [Variovorax sp. WS11]
MNLRFQFKRHTVLLSAALLMGCSPVRILNSFVPEGTYQREAGIAYGTEPRQQLDVYQPLAGGEPTEGQRPLILFFYGGNWSQGERADYRFVGEALSARGAVVVIPDYRLSPQVTYPEFLRDGARALQWSLRNAASLGADPKRVYVMGHSAGAYIAGMLALDARWLNEAGAGPDQLAGWIGLAGPYDFLPIGDPRTRLAFNWPDTPANSQPLVHVSPASPPALLMAASNDRVVDPRRNTARMVERLRAAGVEVTTREFDDLGHATLIGAVAKPLEWIGGPVLPPILSFVGLAPADSSPYPRAAAAATMRATLASSKKSAGDITPAFTRAKPSIASWLPCTASSSCCSSGGGGSSLAKSQLNSYIGRACVSRVAWYSPIAASKPRSPENAWSSAVAQSSASRNASWMPCAVMNSLS